MLKDVMCKGLVSIFHKKTKIVVETIRENKKTTVIYLSIFFCMSSPAKFTILFLRKSFWTITVNTFFIFYTPFACPFFTSCHYDIMTRK
jgi:hypothetical protein